MLAQERRLRADWARPVGFLGPGVPDCLHRHRAREYVREEQGGKAGHFQRGTRRPLRPLFASPFIPSPYVLEELYDTADIS